MNDYLRMDKSQFSRRITEQMLLYWHNLRGTKKLPSYSQVGSLQDNEEMGGDAFIVRVDNGEECTKYIYEYLGDNIVKTLGGSCSSSVLSLVSNLTGSFSGVLQGASPVIEESDFVLRGVKVKFRFVLLPISDEENLEEVRYILGGVRMKNEDLK